ncbi:MAG TPA: CRISPR-associated endonuclease Cas3'' [Candidatus Binatia bacterium]|nr:CRISPR-associated endonuclease Cas3'' [Candidatus Binatia bacterium]
MHAEQSFKDFFFRATGHAPYAYQTSFAQADEFPDLLEAPTGAGKTATAVLGWLWKRRHGTAIQRAAAGRRLVFCLPMRTLVEQSLGSVLRWRANLQLSDDDVGVHAIMGGAIDDAWEGFPDRDAVIIGTQDQLLSRALMRGYAMSRFLWPIHFALLNSDCTWVMDEVQLMSVGASTGAQLQAFRERLSVAGRARTVWMTATLDETLLKTVDVTRAYSKCIVDGDEPALVRRATAAKKLSRAAAYADDVDALAKEIADAHIAGSLTLVVVNRVRRAQQLSAALRLLGSQERIALIHSRFRPAERRRVQDEVMRGDFEGILVATQAIEAGVDISARTMFSELAPWPSMVQRFGRLNRAGEHAETHAFWIDLDTTDADVCLPYDRAVLESSRVNLESLSSAASTVLATVPLDKRAPALPILRRRDLMDLFDTEPDLAGRDIDVSRYVRTSNDRDVQVAWRDLGSDRPGRGTGELHRDELCTVPIPELRKLTKGKKAWRFDGLKREWVEIERFYPGLAILVDMEVGGYDTALGFTGESRNVPVPVDVTTAPPDANESDSLTYGAAEYVTLATHSDDAAAEMAGLLESLGHLLQGFVDPSTLLAAARWHDAGKVHPAFQAMLVDALPDNDARRQAGPWAKSDGSIRSRNPRKFFRHEVVSALAWLFVHDSTEDLGAYLVAAHHGKVRLTLRARPGETPPGNGTRFAHGVYEGDRIAATDLGSGVVVPEMELSLQCMEMGSDAGSPSWSDRMGRLLEEFGPFRLAYLETLVRIADWRASRKRMAASSDKAVR